jgi:hypothetical protein
VANAVAGYAEHYAAKRAERKCDGEHGEDFENTGGKVIAGKELAGLDDREKAIDGKVEPFDKIADQCRQDHMRKIFKLTSADDVLPSCAPRIANATMQLLPSANALRKPGSSTSGGSQRSYPRHLELSDNELRDHPRKSKIRRLLREMRGQTQKR